MKQLTCMKTKMFEVRDRSTFLPMIAIRMHSNNLREDFLLKKSGYGREQVCIFLTDISAFSRGNYDPYDWRDRTRTVAHDFIQKNWDELESGDVVDVEYILGETKEKKKSEGF